MVQDELNAAEGLGAHDIRTDPAPTLGVEQCLEEDSEGLEDGGVLHS